MNVFRWLRRQWLRLWLMVRPRDARVTLRAEIIGTIDVCECCMLIHANGECGDHDEHGEGYEPLSRIGFPEYTVTMGLLAEEHSEYCTEEDREADQCDCEGPSFSWQSCEGCGSHLGGNRYKLTLWREPVRI